MYIQPNSAGLNHIGFASSANSSERMSGFRLVGKTIFWESDAGSLETYFYAVPTTIDDVYNLMWGKEGGSAPGAVPVALRQLEPSSRGIEQLLLKARTIF